MAGNAKDADVIVVGGGVVGLWTAYHLASQGVKTLLLEQFSYPHTRGSSHGQTRITRASYAEEEYSALMPEAQRRWKELEKKSNKKLFVNTGLLSIYEMKSKENEDGFYSMLDNLRRHDITHHVVPGESVGKSFPGIKSNSDFKAIYDAEAGFLKADNCTMALRDCFKLSGGQLQEGEPVVAITPIHQSRVQVKTTKKTYSCSSVVLTCGAYINNILATVSFKVPVQPRRIEVTYWKDKSVPGRYSAENDFPCAIVYPCESAKHFYLIPTYEYPGLVKVCTHFGPPCDPSNRDALTDEMKADHKMRRNWLKEDMQTHFPEIDAEAPAITEVCMYTQTPDAKYILDHHPKYKNIVIGTGFSGHGFKASPSVGHVLANMALGLQAPYLLEPFSLKRFPSTSKL